MSGPTTSRTGTDLLDVEPLENELTGADAN